MAEAYAALVSLIHVLDNIQLYAHHLISLETDLIKSVGERVDFLLEFLEAYSNMRGIKEATEALESQMRDAAYEAEDIIESHVVNQILDPTTQGRKEVHLIKKRGSRSKDDTADGLAQGLKAVIDRMDFIKKVIMQILDDSISQTKDQWHKISKMVSELTYMEDNGVTGLEDVSIEILDRLTGHQSLRKIIPIIGMGGIGKTTLARNVYVNPLAVHYFDHRSWVTISQDYDVRVILSCLLKEMGVEFEANNTSEDRLGELLYKKLFGRRYLIVIDDLWSIDAWDKVKLFLPDNNNGSRIMMTTRLSNVANHFGSCGIEMSFLNEDQSWRLFCKKVFGGEEFPIELEEIGKNIVKKCKGLPLSISVIGGFLAKSEKTNLFWKSVGEDINSIIKSEDENHCMKILELSYRHLPIHLKPCFLYFGFHPEDHEFVVSKLIKIWVAEGFLRPTKDKTLEEVAEDHIRDLVHRNLVLVMTRGPLGEIKSCSIHDLLRELCLKQVQRDNFIHNIQLPLCVNSHRRLFIPRNTSENKESMDKILSSFQSTPSFRTLICEYGEFMVIWKAFRLLRVSHVVNMTAHHLSEAMTKFVNSRYICLHCDSGSYENYNDMIDSMLEFEYSRYENVLGSMHQFWNLQTLMIRVPGFWGTLLVPNEIWEMRQLRHILIDPGFYLPQPQATQVDGQDDDVVLQNLKTLSNLVDFMFTKEAVKRIPNINKLRFCCYKEIEEFEQLLVSCLNNLSRLSKLESLHCYFRRQLIKVDTPQCWLDFPCSLKRLTLEGCKLPWEHMMIIGSLPNLQVLKLYPGSFMGQEWKPNEGEFLSLRFLEMRNLDIEFWMADNTHFPCLQHLNLYYMFHLLEIPLEFVDIPTLLSIKLGACSESIEVSARRIQEERVNLGDQDLQLQIA